jgi:phosphate starvation-inducible PhoH-like protein
VEGISFVYFDERDVVRHSLVQRIVKAYERYQDLTGTGRQLALRLAEPPVEAATSASEPPSLAEAQGPEIPLN